jgi:hypothetical protein
MTTAQPPSFPAEPAADPRPRIAAQELTKLLKDGRAVGEQFSNHIIEGDVDLNSIAYGHKLVIHNSVFRGRFDASEARFDCAIDLSGCTFEQGVDCEGACIDGQLCLDRAVIQAPGKEPAANLKQIQVERNCLAQLVRVEGPFLLEGAKVAVSADFEGAQITGDLNLQNADIGADLFCGVRDGQRTDIGGRVWLSGAKVAGKVDFDGAQVGGEVNLSEAEVAGEIAFCGAQIAGTLNLRNADIGADLLCGDLAGQPTEIGGNVIFRGAQVGVWLYGTRVAGQVDFSEAMVGGQAVLSGAKVAGQVDFSGARIAGDLNLRNADLAAELFCGVQGGRPTEIGKDAIFLGARIGAAHLDGRCCPAGVLDLSLAEFTRLEITEALPRQIATEGLRFQQLSLPRNDYGGFLKASKPFQKSTYQFTENWLRNRGDEGDANKVYLEMRRRERREGLRGFARLWDWFLEKTVGYGLRTYRLGLFWLLPVFVLTVVLFSSPRSVNHSVVVTATEAGNAQTVIDPSRFPDSWTPLDAFWVAVRINVPLVNLGVKTDWSPSSERIPWLGISYETYAGLVALTSWITVPLFLAAFSGVLKREK